MSLPTRPVSRVVPVAEAPAEAAAAEAPPASPPPDALPDAPVETARAADVPAPPPAAQSAPAYGWLFLLGLALIIALIDPIVLAFEPHPEVGVVLLLAGAGLLGLGLWRRLPAARWAGTALLWIEIALGICTQISPLALAPGFVWGPRGLLLSVALLGWLLFLGLPSWLRRGVLAAAIPTLGLFAALWLTAPPIPRNAGLYWMAVDSQGTLYATDVDNGEIWVFDGNGNPVGNLWPRRGVVGKPGPGILPEAEGAGLATLGVVATPTPGGITEREFLFCGLAVDPSDNLYVADPELFQMRVFAPGGQLRASWTLPDTFIPGRGCLAADHEHVYLNDNHGLIYIYDLQGTLQTQWNQDDLAIGLSSLADNQLVVLRQSSVAVLQYPQGNVLTQWNLPEPTGDLRIPYQAILSLPGGKTLVTDVGTSQLRFFGPDHQQLPALGAPGGWPGQFNGVGGVAVDPQGRLYVSDFMSRTIQRFAPDGHIQAVWTVPEGENGE